MSFLLKTVRVKGFRGLDNIEVQLEQTTILTGMNNSGKTSLLKALQLALGNHLFVSQDDFYIRGSSVSEKIIVDLEIIPIDSDGKKCDIFSDNLEELFTTERIRLDINGQSSVPLRTIITFDAIRNNFKTQKYILQMWPKFKENDDNWYDCENGNKTTFLFEELPFFYVDAQRDIIEDAKSRGSYLGKMLSKIEYTQEDIKDIEEQIEKLNEKTVAGSDILSKIKSTLKELNTAMDTTSDGVEVTPFTKKIRDLNKGLTIHYSDTRDSFSMEYHGMGTRSWSSLLTLKAFISLLSSKAVENSSAFFPFLAIEEPESHLHPNAQKRLYQQMNAIHGQKIISTHSPYIAAIAKLSQIRNFYKNDHVTCGKIDINSLTKEDIRKIKRQVINTRGEIFFSKLIVFFEGETEEQALPVLAHKYFGITNVEMGIDFIGVGGFRNYLPFLRFAEALKIPWMILSDAEDAADNNVKDNVKGQYLKCGTNRNETDCIVFLDAGRDFEKQLIDDGYAEEIKKAIASLDVYTSEQHRVAKEKIRLIEIEGFDEKKLYDLITGSKTRFAPAIAEQIVQSGKDLPPNIAKLFGKIEILLNTQEA